MNELSNTERLLRLKKILFVATVSIHFQYFYLPYFDFLKKNGWEVSSACLDPVDMPGCDKTYKILMDRQPYSIKNIVAYKQLKQIINNNKFDVVHCSTPMAGVLARITANKARKHGAKVIYTAHGFHFFKGAPLFNWLIYFPVERFLSRKTDCLITINSEDYKAAKNHLIAGQTVIVHGVGYDNKRFTKPGGDKKSLLRREYGYSDDEILLVYVAELNGNKNQKLLIRALKMLADENEEVRLLLVGPDRTGGKIHTYAKNTGLEGRVVFFGQRNDVCKILPMCDLAVASSRREGLPVNIMESLACGLPVVASKNRGHLELIEDGYNGYLVELDDCEALTRKIIQIIRDKDLYRRLSENACNSVVGYGIERVLEEMKGVYGRL